MVKTPKMRHSKIPGEPVTIELQPDEISRVAEEPTAEPAAAATDESRPEQIETQDEKDATAARQAYQPTYDFDDTPRPTANEPEDDVVPATRRGGMNALAAGVVGGVIALLGAGALQYAGLLGAPGAGTSLDGVNGEISALKTQIASISNSENGGDAAGRVKGLSDALDQVRTDVAALKSSVGSQTGDTAGVADLSDKVAALETKIASLGQAGNVAPVDLGPLNEKLASLDTLVKSAGDAATERQNQLGALEQSVSQLSTKVEAQASQPKIALAIAASALKAALDRGAPFAAELETFAAIAPDAPQLATLRAYAEKGVASRTDIASGTDDAATAMVSAATPLGQDAGFLQNLMSSAESLVKVRPIGAVEGAGVPETVARMEAAIKQDDYARALVEYATLPDAVKAAGADLAEKLKARLDVEAQVDALIAQAMKA